MDKQLETVRTGGTVILPGPEETPKPAAEPERATKKPKVDKEG